MKQNGPVVHRYFHCFLTDVIHLMKSFGNEYNRNYFQLNVLSYWLKPTDDPNIKRQVPTSAHCQLPTYSTLCTLGIGMELACQESQVSDIGTLSHITVPRWSQFLMYKVKLMKTTQLIFNKLGCSSATSKRARLVLQFKALSKIEQGKI